MNLDPFKENPKTSFLAGVYEKLEKDETEIRAMIEKDPSYAELAAADLASFVDQKKSLEKDMNDILEADKKEDEKPAATGKEPEKEKDAEPAEKENTEKDK